MRNLDFGPWTHYLEAPDNMKQHPQPTYLRLEMTNLDPIQGPVSHQRLETEKAECQVDGAAQNMKSPEILDVVQELYGTD
jgi:hypothetical protein